MSGIISGVGGITGTQPATIQMNQLYLKSGAASQAASTLTIGNQWYTTSVRTLLGGTFYWPNTGGGNQTIKVGYWAAGSMIDSVSKTVSAAGTYTVTFPSTHAVNPYTAWLLTMYRTDAAGYAQFDGRPSGFVASATAIATVFAAGTSLGVYVGPYLVWGGSWYSSGADVAPATALNAAQITPLDPILDIS